MMRRLIISGAILAVSAGMALAQQDKESPGPLSLHDCIRIGLQNNLRLHNAQLDVDLATERLVTANAMFDPRVSLGITHTDSELTDATSFFPGSKQITDASVGLQKAFSTGTRVSLEAGQNRFSLASTNSFLMIPPYSGTVSLSVSQSILRNAFGELDRAVLDQARTGRRLAQHLYVRETEMLCANISDAYWSLYEVSMNRRTAEVSLTRARKLLETNRKRFDDGLLDETSILAAEALIATREVHVLALRDAVENATDGLRLTAQIPRDRWEDAVFAMPRDAEIRGMTERPTQVNSKTAITRALRGRPDLLALRDIAGLSETDLFMKKSSGRPDLQLIGAVTQGSSGTTFDEGLELDDTSWTVALQLEIPLLRRSERSAVRQSALELSKAHNNVRALESAIELECRAAARNVVTSYQRVMATSKAVGLHRRKLELEGKKFKQGRSATHLIIQYQNDLTAATMGMNVAIGNYQKALVKYRLAQGLMPVELRGPHAAKAPEGTE